ncbi:putative reverse transcriptase domain-containing protein [Tanacetum coccineum]
MSSDKASSEVTYTSISSDYKELSNVGSPGVIVDGYNGLPMHPVDPPSLDYVPGLEEAEQAPLSPDYVPGPEYLEYLALSDKEIPVEDQHYAPGDSPIALSLGYIADSDLEEDPKNESEDGPTDYPADGGDDNDDDDSSGDDADDEDEEEASKEDEVEEHLAPADSTAAASLVVDPVPSAEETKPFETNEFVATPPLPPTYCTTARIQDPVEDYITTTITFILTTTITTTYHTSTHQSIYGSDESTAPSTYILAPRSGTLPSGTLPSGTPPSRTPPSGTPPLLPIPLPPLLLPSTKCRADVLEVALPPRKRFGTELLAIPTPPSSLLTSLSFLLPRIPSPPFPVPSPLTTSPTDAGAPLGYKAAKIRLRTASPPPLPLSPLLLLPPPIILPRTRASMVLMRAAAPSTYILTPRSGTLLSGTPPSGTPPSGTLPSGTLPSRIPSSGTPPLLPIPLPTSSPPLLLPSTNCRAGIPEVALPPRKRLCIAPGPRYEIGESSSAPTGRPIGGFRADYGFVGTLDAKIRRDPDREIGYKITDVWEDLDDIAEEIPATDVAELGHRMTDFVTTVRQDTDEIYKRLDDAQSDQSLMTAACEAWVQSMDANDTTHSEVRALRITVLAQQTEIGDLRPTDRRRQAQFVEALTLMRTLQTQMVALQSQQRPAGDPAHPDVPEEKKMPLSKAHPGTHPPTATALPPTPNYMKHDIRALISRGMADALAEHEIQRKNNLNGDGSQEWRVVFNISNCVVENQVKFATCTLHGVALTWWKSHVKIVWSDAAHAYTQTFSEVGFVERRMFPEESDKIEKSVVCLPDMIHKNKKKYAGSLPKCSKCNNHHNGPCTSKCHKCNKVGHLARDCRSSGNANTGNNQRTIRPNQRGNDCYVCGAQGNFKRECPKLKNNNHGNQGENGYALAKVYVVGNAGTNPYSHVFTGYYQLQVREEDIPKTAFRTQYGITSSKLCHLVITSIKAVPFEVLYGRKCRSPVYWAEVGDRVMLKVSPWKWVIRFGQRGKLNPRYAGLLKVLEKVESIAYKLELPQELSRVHSTFYVSNLKKCYFDEPLAVPLDGIHIDDKLHFMEELVEIMDREVKWLKQSHIPIVKVRWNFRRGPEFTREREDQFQKKYPHLFTKTAPSTSAAS